MKTIAIRQITLLNFKGIRNLTVDFDEFETNIFGANGTGKTTVFDAFSWLLFGKDSKDRKDFNIKTLDKDNKPIERIPHEVTACITVNGEDINLKKCYSESWKRTRGSQEEKFSGHTLECYYNDVPCSVSEYTKKINEICTEEVFKLITSPTYFVKQKKEFQRNMLLQLVGDVTNESLVAYNKDFTEVVNLLAGKTIDELKREIAARKRKIKEGIEGIPARIDERKRDMPEELDWSILERDIAISEEKVTKIQEKIKDYTTAYNEQTKAQQEVARNLSRVRSSITQREYALKDSLLADYNNKIREHENSLVKLSQLENNRKIAELSLPRLTVELSDLNKTRESLIEKWHEIKAEKFIIDDNELCCPVCHRPLEADDMELKKEQMLAEFNANIAKKIENNKAKGLETKSAIEVKEKEIKSVNDTLFRYDEQIAALKASSVYNEIPDEPNIKPLLDADPELLKFKKEEESLQAQLSKSIEAPDTSSLFDELRKEQDLIKTNQIFLEDRKKISENNKRIAELEKELSESQAQYAELEGTEFKIMQFSKAKMDLLESKIGKLFSIVKFKMFEQQINGGEVETCEAMVDGVPYSDLNRAMKCNAGLDIINAFVRIYGIKAPIFIDNRESVSDILDVASQVINLFVDKNCKTLKIE